MCFSTRTSSIQQDLTLRQNFILSQSFVNYGSVCDSELVNIFLSLLAIMTSQVPKKKVLRQSKYIFPFLELRQQLVHRALQSSRFYKSKWFQCTRGPPRRLPDQARPKPDQSPTVELGRARSGLVGHEIFQTYKNVLKLL